ncbi:MAG: hypothetical protein AAGG11_18185 [Pseudomonadota bacterium]
MSDESTPLNTAELADKAADRKILRDISLSIAGMMGVAVAIFFIANSIAG